MSALLPVIAVEQVTPAEANPWLVKWDHPLGACNRPFRQEAHLLVVDGRVAAATISASIVSAKCDRYRRGEVVELARIGRSDDFPWAMRPMLRLWRAVLALRWACWPVRAAVSYALPGYSGNIYGFDGWRRVGEVQRSGGGGTWSKAPKVNALPGRKTLWVFDYQPTPGDPQ